MLDPAHRKAQAEGDILRCVFPRLIEWRTGDEWGWRLGAAEAIEQDGPTRVRFTLRPGILFTGGFGEMTADDVKFSYERIADPAQRSEYRDDFAALDRVDVLDRYAGVIVLKEPFAPLWTSTLPSASGCILSRKAVEQAGGRFTTAPPATAGPYVIEEWRPKQRLTLVRNPDWNGPPGGFDEIRILPIEDEKAAEIAFEAGELDYTAISVSSIPGYRAGQAPGVQLVEKPSLDYVWLGINVEAPPFDDPRVRRAVQRAIDVDQVLEAAYFGVARRATGIIAPGLIGHRREAAGRPAAGSRRGQGAARRGGARRRLRLHARDRGQGRAPARRPGDPGATSPRSGSRCGSTSTIPAASGRSAARPTASAGARSSWSCRSTACSPIPPSRPPGSRPSRSGSGTGSASRARSSARCTGQAMVETDPARRDRMYRRMQDLMEESGAYVFLTHEVNAAVCRDAVAPALLPDATPVLPEFRSG